MSDSAFPDGLGERHVRAPSGLAAHSSLVSLLVLAALLAVAMTGLLAGDRAPTRLLDVPAARMAVTVPDSLRNGEFFEMRIAITAKTDIAELVVALPPGLWRDMTINTMIPAPADETFADGRYRFSYGRLAVGDTFVIKVDGQINPPLTLGTRGEAALFDGDRALGSLPVAIRVLP